LKRQIQELISLRLLIAEGDRSGHRPLYRVLVEFLRREGVAGVSVYRGIMGFGAHHQTHQDSLVRFSSDLPLTLELIDRAEVIDRVEPLLAVMVKGGLMFRQRIEAVRYETGGEKGC